MGRKWRRREQAAIATEEPNDYKWSSQSYTLKGILASFKLPVVVQCREDTDAQNLQNFFFDLRQPILLHSRRTSRKVFARCVRTGEGGTVKELLPEVVIPEDYAGWFKLSKGLEFAKPVPHKSVEAIAETSSGFFLCTTEFNAIVVTESVEDDENSSASFVRPVVEGEVLRKTGIQKLNRLLLPEPERSFTLDNRYLLCIDEKDCELFVPLSQTGLFYEVSDGNFDKNDNSVVQISDLLDEMVELPLYVRHILGDPPPISKFYSPNLKLVRVMEEETVMGSTLETDEEALPLEIQSNSPIKFEIALNTRMLQLCSEYTEAVELCNNLSPSYVTDMKLAVTFKLKPEEETITGVAEGQDNPAFSPDSNEQLDSLTNSMRTTLTTNSAGKESECGEEEANSEFNIQWQPTPNPSARNTPDNTCAENDKENECESVDGSVDTEQAKKLNTVLGGHFFNTEQRPYENIVSTNISPPVQWLSKSLSDTNLGQSEQSEYFVFNSNQTVDSVSPYDHITEEITDFSVRPTEADVNTEICGSPVVIAPPMCFSDSLSSLPSTMTARSSKSSNVPSSNSTVASSNISLSEFFSKVKHENQNFNMDVDEEGPPEPVVPTYSNSYMFTGDVFISPDSDGSTESLHSRAESDISSRGSICESWNSWEENKYRVVRRKNIQEIPRNGRTNPLPVAIDSRSDSGQGRSVSLCDDLIHFDDPSKTSSTSSIVTCKVADEMVSSCNDLRLSLDEITRHARDSHVESSWQAFCLERSSSLPVRSASKPQIRDIDENQSQSWEQISPRRSESNSNSLMSTPRYSDKSKHVTKPKDLRLNLAHEDKLQLISDTCSEDSSQYSNRSVDSANEQLYSGDNSFTLSESSDSSDMSVTEGPESVLAAIAEMNVYLDQVSTGDSANQGSAHAQDSASIKQKIKIQREIKRKQFGNWNDNAVII
ncbi:uncharacterized protein LOC128212948 isoform X2 [Mya arenaria]|nr:uncharacterized protein LOC128212948 isoform X2 [Mya arenaria]XP_052774320.1 uncharacterized protein LOC128212948 isoform X2 [Mya arenaria]